MLVLLLLGSVYMCIYGVCTYTVLQKCVYIGCVHIGRNVHIYCLLVICIHSAGVHALPLEFAHQLHVKDKTVVECAWTWLAVKVESFLSSGDAVQLLSSNRQDQVSTPCPSERRIGVGTKRGHGNL